MALRTVAEAAGIPRESLWPANFPFSQPGPEYRRSRPKPLWENRGKRMCTYKHIQALSIKSQRDVPFQLID